MYDPYSGPSLSDWRLGSNVKIGPSKIKHRFFFDKKT